MVRSSGFGSVNYDLKPLSGSLSLWLRYSLILTLPQPTSRQLILQQARSRALSRSSTACKLTISCSISLPSRGSFHLSLAVLCAIGHPGIFSLTRWSSQIHTEFHVLRATRDTARSTHLSITGLSPSMARHSNVSSRIVDPYCCPTTPIVKTIGLGYSPFARRY